MSLASVKEPHKEGGGEGRMTLLPIAASGSFSYGDRVMNQGNNIAINKPNVFSIIAMKISRVLKRAQNIRAHLPDLHGHVHIEKF